MNETSLNPNAIAFIGLATEFCRKLEQTSDEDSDEFVSAMLRLLPRIYISATDLKSPNAEELCGYIDNVLDEDHYETIRRNVETLMGENDTYLEVFVEDMKYSDTPVAASISEGLTDMFQSLYNFLNTVKDAPSDVVSEAIVAVKDDFRGYWSATLCNVLRALNNIAYSA